MGVLSSKLIISLVDQVSGPAKGMKQSLQNLLGLQGRNGVLGVGQAFGKEMKKVQQRTAGASAAVSAPAGYLGFSAFREAYQFEKQMNLMEALGDLTGEQRQEMEAYMKELSTKYPQSIDKIAATMNELLRGGLTPEAAKGAMDSTLGLSIFGDIDPAEAAEIAIAMASQWGLLTDTSENAAASMLKGLSLIAWAANESSTDVRLMGESFKYAAPLSAALGIPMEDLAGMLMVMANAGIKGAEAGVALRSAFVRLLRPTKESQAILAQLGINLNDYVTGGKKIESQDIIAGLAASGIDASPFAEAIDAALNDPAIARAPEKLVQRLTQVISEGLGSTSIVDAEALAVNLTDLVAVAGSKIDFVGFMNELVKKAGPNLANAFVRIFDMRQGGRLLTLAADDINKFIESLSGIPDDYLSEGVATMLKGIVGPTLQIAAAFSRMAAAISESGVFADFAAVFTRIADSMDRLAKTNPEMLKLGTYAAMAAVALGPLGLIIQGLGSTLALLGSAARIAALGIMFLGRALVVAPIAAFARYVGNARVQLALLAATTQGGSLARIGGTLLTLLAPIRMVTGALKLLRAALIGTGIGAALVGIAIAGEFIYNNWSGITEMFAGIGEGFMSSLGPARPVVEALGSALAQVVGWIGDLAGWLINLGGPIDASKEEWRGWGVAIGQTLAMPLRQFGEMVAGISALFGSIGGLLAGDTAAWTAWGQGIANAIMWPIQKLQELSGWITSIGSSLASIKLPSWLGGEPDAPAPFDAAGAAVGAAGAGLAGGRAPGGGAAPAAPKPALGSVPIMPDMGMTLAQAGSAKNVIDGLVSSAQAMPAQVSSAAQSAMNQLRSIIASADLTDEGRRLAESLARGIRSGIPAIAAAASAASAAAAQGAMRASLSDAGR